MAEEEEAVTVERVLAAVKTCLEKPELAALIASASISFRSLKAPLLEELGLTDGALLLPFRDDITSALVTLTEADDEEPAKKKTKKKKPAAAAASEDVPAAAAAAAEDE